MGARPIITTVGGHELGDVVSALQKAIRRGQVDDAIYWVVDLDLGSQDGTSYAEYAWSRMLVMASEDVGLADPECCVRIRSLYDTYKQLKAKKNDHKPERLMLVHAAIDLARAAKSRLVDVALLSHYANHAEYYRDIPDYALDGHTRRGRRMGRGPEFFYDVAAQVDATESDALELEPRYEKAARDL